MNQILVNKKTKNLFFYLKNLKIDKYTNLIRNLRYQLEIYNNEETIVSYGLRKELYKKIIYIAKQITKKTKNKDKFKEFIGDRNKKEDSLKSFEAIKLRFKDLTNLFEDCKEEILNGIDEDDVNYSHYKKELNSYAKTNYSLSQKTKTAKVIRRRDFIAGYLFTIPALTFVSIFVLFSVIYALWTSLNIVQVYGNGLLWKFVGFDQYVEVAKSSLFKRSLVVSITYMGMVAPIQTVIALILSSVLASKIKGNKIFLVIYFLPTLTSSTALTMIFLRLAGDGGPLESILGRGFSSKHILGLIAIMNIWSTVPLFITTFNAAHSDIPKSQYEAMSIDGAGPIKKFFSITVPYLRPITAYVLMMGVIGTLQMFDQAYMIAKDPSIHANSRDLITTSKYIFDKAFGISGFAQNDFGKSAAAAIIFTSIILSFSIVSSFVSKPAGGK